MALNENTLAAALAPALAAAVRASYGGIVVDHPAIDDAWTRIAQAIAVEVVAHIRANAVCTVTGGSSSGTYPIT